jgi:anti-sigma factor RsiW
VSAPEHLHEDVGAYLLGALADHERDAFEAHLADCASCRDELERLRPAAQALPRSVDPLQAPAGLKASLMEAVREEGGEAPAVNRPRRRLRLSLPRLSPALAALLLALGVGAGFGLAGVLEGDDTRSITATAQSREAARATGTLSVPGSGADGAILHVSGLPPLEEGVYQAWVQRGREVVPQPTFEVGESGVGAVAVPDDLRDARAVMVTREPRGGSRAPTGPAIMVVRL